MAEEAHPLHVAEVGKGRPLVLIHGWATSGRALSGLAGSLAEVARVVLPDLRGHGRSPPPEGPFSLDDHGADVTSLVRGLGLVKPVLAGWSLGAQVALSATARLEAEGVPVAGLALLAPTARFTSAEGYPHGLSEREVDGLASRLSIHPAKALSRFFAACFAKGELSTEERERACAELVREPPDLNAALGALRALAEGDQRRLAGALLAPALLLHGEEDAIVPPGASKALEDALRSARRLTFPGVGHAPFLSRGEACARSVRAFLSELP
jgi:pimeloyl-[acyl-carrier protein] methyl ester esterase